MKKILFIEDEPDLITLIKTRLEANDFEVVTAADGEEGLKKVYEERPSLVLLDVIMPKMDGFEVCRRLKSDPEVAGIPVVIITASGVRDVEKKSFEAGAQGFIRKPFEPTDLLWKIKNLTQEKA